MTFLTNLFDSHVHFVDPDQRPGLDWPPLDSPLYRRFTPQHLIDATAPACISGCIAVETSRQSADDDWLLQLSVSDPLIAGVVLNLQPDLPGFVRRLDAAMDQEVFKGIRLRPIEEYDLRGEALLQSLGLLQEYGKTIEFGARSRQLKARFAELAQRFPGTTFILDHCGHPDMSSVADAEWRDAISLIAELPNAVCKVSAEYGDGPGWLPLLDFLQQAFGPSRLLFASNWPVCTLSLRLPAVIAQLAHYMGDNSEAFFGGNARQVYCASR